MSKVLSKKRIGKIIIFALIIVSIYYIYVLIATNGIMKTAREVAAGEVTVESDTPYARFSPRGEHKHTCNIKRYFAYCGIEKGKIFVTCVDVINFNDGKVHTGRDWLTIFIEKTEDGEWEAVRTLVDP